MVVLAIFLAIVFVVMIMELSSRSFSRIGITGRIMGPIRTTPPEGLRYVCETGPHHVHPANINKKAPGGNSLCPVHDKEMVAIQDCTGH